MPLVLLLAAPHNAWMEEVQLQRCTWFMQLLVLLCLVLMCLAQQVLLARPASTSGSGVPGFGGSGFSGSLLSGTELSWICCLPLLPSPWHHGAG